MYFCTRNEADVPRNPDKQKESIKKIYFQKRFKKACEKRKSFVLLHPLIERLAYKKQEEHVPRHIELTAVSSTRRDK